MTIRDIKKMPDESCRSCGCMIITYSICCKCKQSTQKMFVKCGIQTMPQFHDTCFYEIEAIQTVSFVGAIAS